MHQYNVEGKSDDKELYEKPTGESFALVASFVDCVLDLLTRTSDATVNADGDEGSRGRAV